MLEFTYEVIPVCLPRTLLNGARGRASPEHSGAHTAGMHRQSGLHRSGCERRARLEANPYNPRGGWDMHILGVRRAKLYS